MGKRLNIGLFIGIIESDFSYSVVEGAMMGAKAIDANLFIIPAGIVNAKYDDEELNSFRYQYNTLYSLANNQSFDAILIEYGTITSFLSEEEQRAFLAQFKDVPVLLLYANQDDYSTINVNNKAGMHSVMEHLIEKHHYEKIAFVSGPKDNSDAQERLQVYKDELQAHGIAIDEDYIMYGNFSEYCEDMVADFVTAHPDVEAIAFANDSMAVGGYRGIRKVGKKPGVDIYVTGFDDSPAAVLLEPNLTTVKADTREIAYMAVAQCEKIIKGELVHASVDSRLVVRDSCGCAVHSSDEVNVLDEEGNVKIKEALMLAKDVFNKHFNFYFGDEKRKNIEDRVVAYFREFLSMTTPDGKLNEKFDYLERRFEEFSNIYYEGYVSLASFYMIHNMLRSVVLKQLAVEEEKQRFVLLLDELIQSLALDVVKHRNIIDEKSKLFEVMLSTTTRDMLQFSKNEGKRYESVVNKFKLMEFDSSYLFVYEKGVAHSKDDRWEFPSELYMKAYHNKDVVKVMDGIGGEQTIDTQRLFSHNWMPKDRRVDMIVMPLFSGEMQYGLLVTESDANFFRYASQLACQISASIEVIEILNRQNEIKNELEQNLEQIKVANKKLDVMSRMDPLTKIANRRGFLGEVEALVMDPLNYGKRAVAIYADLDKLKVINDEFGHDDGDFAIQSIANILKSSLRSNDVVARMGGDEFAAFAIGCKENFADEVRKRIADVSKKFNAHCDKPYYVNMSVGAYEFVIDASTNIDEVLNHADELLYNEKKNKVRVVYKNPPQE